jgi:hypothetical protein
MFLYFLIFMFLDDRREDGPWRERWETFPEFNLLLIS